jgi:HprK-related kinase A
LLIRESTVGGLEAMLNGQGLALDLGAARVKIRSDVPGLAFSIHLVYADYAIQDPSGFFDATIGIARVRGYRKRVRAQIELLVDGDSPFEPFPADTHLPLMEWGLNHALAERLSHFLLLHSGSLAKGDSGLLLPATPGSGKSTLTAALMCSGYRLLSDEFGVLSPETGLLNPMVRPIALKNQSIDVIRQFAPQSVIGPEFPKTRKGTVAHVSPSSPSVRLRGESAVPTTVVFPKFEANADVIVEDMDPGSAFNKLALNSFNYEFLGPISFDAVTRLVSSCRFVRMTYGRLAEAIATVDELVQRGAKSPERVSHATS